MSKKPSTPVIRPKLKFVSVEPGRVIKMCMETMLLRGYNISAVCDLAGVPRRNVYYLSAGQVKKGPTADKLLGYIEANMPDVLQMALRVIGHEDGHLNGTKISEEEVNQITHTKLSQAYGKPLTRSIKAPERQLDYHHELESRELAPSRS